jgi:2,4-dienoyl-CoA reductase-like NADH-dependent reductase (Old Yellow Enzyme family)
MPTLTLTHEAPLELIRQYPALAAELVAAVTDVVVPADPSSVRLGPTDMNNVIPVQFTADSVIVVSDAATGAPALIVIVEPQGRDDKTKKYAWPAYITNARRAAQCERAVLLVICPDPSEAEKCRKVIRTGHPEFDLWPVVIDPLHAPGLDNASPYLVIFAACVP